MTTAEYTVQQFGRAVYRPAHALRRVALADLRASEQRTILRQMLGAMAPERSFIGVETLVEAGEQWRSNVIGGDKAVADKAWEVVDDVSQDLAFSAAYANAMAVRQWGEL